MLIMRLARYLLDDYTMVSVWFLKRIDRDGTYDRKCGSRRL